MKLASQIVPPPIGPNDISNRDYVASANVAAQGAYVQAKLSADQTGITADNTKIEFDTVYKSRGDLTVDSSGNFSTLKAGRTYFLIAELFTITTTGDRFPYNWYDQTGAVDIGSAGTATPPNENSDAGYTNVALAIITPTVDTTVELRSSDSFGTAISISSGSSGWGDHLATAIIMEVGASSNVIAETILSAASDTISLAGLDGDLHGEYSVEVDVLISADGGTHTITLEPNGSSANLFGRYEPTSTAETTWKLTSFSSQTDREVGSMVTLFATRTKGGVSRHRKILAETVLTYTASPYSTHYDFRGYWTNTADNLTSLDVVTTITGGFLAGSRVTVRKV